MLARKLPRDSATASAILGDRFTVTEELLASAVDALRGANWQRSGGKGDRPPPYPRPGAVNGDRVGRGTRPLEAMRARARRMLDRYAEEVT